MSVPKHFLHDWRFGRADLEPVRYARADTCCHPADVFEEVFRVIQEVGTELFRLEQLVRDVLMRHGHVQLGMVELAFNLPQIVVSNHLSATPCNRRRTRRYRFTLVK